MRAPGADDRTEVGRLAAALNTMLDRIHESFDERDATEAALRESQQRMRRFVADVSHELRTPLAAVTAYAELLERGARTRPDDVDRAIHGIAVESGRMNELVEELLLLARLDEGRPLEQVTVDLAALLVDAARTARTVAPDHPVALSITEVVTVTGDATRLRQVVDNLLANVRTHTPPGTTTSIALTTNGPRPSSSSPTTVPGCNRSTPSGCSSASTGPTRRGHARPAAPGSACRSSPPSSQLTGAMSASTRRPAPASG